MSKATQEHPTATLPAPEARLEETLPQMLDALLGDFQAVGVQRLMALADELVRARLEQQADSHLVGSATRGN
jgi:hypothetical protein